MLTEFVKSSREGISPGAIEFYRDCLTPFVRRYEINSEGINSFLANLNCGSARLNCYRATKAFCNWLRKQGYISENPIRLVDAPKPGKQILPSLTSEQDQYLIGTVDNIRDKVTISLLADSGIRLNELANIQASDIDWNSYTVTITGKGNKQR
ncbi:MAG: tyrosine-type recombinase/integrase [Dehalococcoidia bacterium]|nr:tyrosine-type recombinase/integrase [Dehalococcoidia bacterium]